MTFETAPKALLGISSLLLVLAALFGVLNSAKVKALHADLARTVAARDAAEHRQMVQEQQTKTPSASMVPTTAKSADAENKAAKAEAELAQLLKERADLQTKVQASQAEIESLRNRPEQVTEAAPVNPGAPSTTELQAQLDDARRQLDTAERENAFLSEKLGTPGKFATTRGRTPAATEPERKRREAGHAKPGVRGTILAVNQGYNFVVLNVGDRQGLEPNSDMLVLHDGTRIGKIRISSVEPATAIGDIIRNSLARGVRVQPGDIVIYANP